MSANRLLDARLDAANPRTAERAIPSGRLSAGFYVGIVAACAISVKKAGLPAGQRAAIVDLLHRFDLPTRLPKKFPRQKIFDALPHDKKFEARKIRFVVTPQIGTARLASNVTMQDVREAVEAL